MCCNFVNILYFDLKFLQYTQYVILSKYVNKIDFLKLEHETTSLIPVKILKYLAL